MVETLRGKKLICIIGSETRDQEFRLASSVMESVSQFRSEDLNGGGDLQFAVSRTTNRKFHLTNAFEERIVSRDPILIFGYAGHRQLQVRKASKLIKQREKHS